MEDKDFDYEIADYDSETETYEINFNLTDDEYNEIHTEYEKYLETKENVEEAVSFDEFFEIIMNMGLYAKQLEIKQEYIKILEVEIEELERNIDNYRLKL